MILESLDLQKHVVSESIALAFVLGHDLSGSQCRPWYRQGEANRARSRMCQRIIPHGRNAKFRRLSSKTMVVGELNGQEDIQVDLLTAAEDFVKDKFKDHDPSHDWHHVHRVRLMAVNLTRCDSLKRSEQPVDMLVVELAALFHDLCDSKYVKDEDTGNPIRAKKVLESFFAPFIQYQLISLQQVHLVYQIVDSVSWSKEEARLERVRKNKAQGLPTGQADLDQEKWEHQCKEFQCVSDADRLDSIGSVGTCKDVRLAYDFNYPIGILRVAAYSGIKNRPLHIPPANAKNDSKPPAEQGTSYNNSAIAHFHAK